MQLHCPIKNSADKALSVYVSLMVDGFVRQSSDESAWSKTARMIHTQWELVKNLTKAAGAMIGLSESKVDIKEPELQPQ